MAPERTAPDGNAADVTPEGVAEALRARIDSGDLKPGDAMPTQATLAANFGVGRGVIRQAMQLLQRQGLFVEDTITRGAPPRIAGVTARAPQETLVALGPRIRAAFEATHVTIDALCLTAESLSTVLAEERRHLVQRHAAGGTVPASVTVRVLLPDRNIDLAFPRAAGEPAHSARVHQRWLKQRNAHGMVLRDHLTGLGDALDMAVNVQFRAIPFTPPVKLYLLNGQEALFAYYQLMRRAQSFGPDSVDMFDARGDESPLFSFGAHGEGDPGGQDAAFVEQSQLWFENLWETIVTNLALD